MSDTGSYAIDFCVPEKASLTWLICWHCAHQTRQSKHCHSRCLMRSTKERKNSFTLSSTGPASPHTSQVCSTSASEANMTERYRTSNETTQLSRSTSMYPVLNVLNLYHLARFHQKEVWPWFTTVRIQRSHGQFLPSWNPKGAPSQVCLGDRSSSFAGQKSREASKLPEDWHAVTWVVLVK